MGDLVRLIWLQIRHQNRVFWRNPIAAVFTLGFPLLFLLLFNLIFSEGPGALTFAQYFTPAIAVFAAVSATFTNLAIGTGLAREQGILKRVRGTPLPSGIYLVGRLGSAVWIAALSVAIMLGVGTMVYDFRISWSSLPAALVAFVVGTSCFAAWGLAIGSLVRRGDAIPVVTNAIILPLAFISGVFIATETMPSWLAGVALVFPLRHFAELFVRAFDPTLVGSAFGWDHIVVMLAWAALGAAIAVRWFSWEPHTGEP